MMGELEYHYKTRVISRMSLHLTASNFPDWPDWELKDQQVSKLLLTSMKNLELSEYLFIKLNKTCR